MDCNFASILNNYNCWKTIFILFYFDNLGIQTWPYIYINSKDKLVPGLIYWKNKEHSLNAHADFQTIWTTLTLPLHYGYKEQPFSIKSFDYICLIEWVEVNTFAYASPRNAAKISFALAAIILRKKKKKSLFFPWISNSYIPRVGEVNFLPSTYHG